MSEKKYISQDIWERFGTRRRLLLLILVIVPSIFAAEVMFSLLPPQSGNWLNGIITTLFAILFSWISIGFWSSLAGVLVMVRKCDRFAAVPAALTGQNLPGDFRTALLFPVYNEDIRKVAEGVRTVWRNLRQKKLDHHFDLYILSDTTDPDVWVTEEEAWYDLILSEGASGRLFYRRRKSNLKKKSGNIADFCRRWGINYRYMVIFDADSLMSALTLARIVQAMEANPEIGILQTPPKSVFSRSLLARVQQFANHLYGPVFAAGLHYWQLGDAQYWGHNAIIRVNPFMSHCQLPKLTGKAPLGGEILSHDFVESALMRRAGYGVWLAYDLEGSYEQNPPSLIDELVRDRRWCQGNLQHSRLIFTKGFFPTHRALFIHGIMSYGSALLWLFFLLASSFEAIRAVIVIPDYFPKGPSLFPDWPQYFPLWALTLLSSTAGLLFLSKALAVVLVMVKGGARTFGGFFRMNLSILVEILVSTFLAPVRMLFHSLFVVTTILGVKVNWNAQNRDNAGTSWKVALRFHWWGSFLGLIWGLLMYRISPGFFLWLSPVVSGLAFSLPLSVWTSRVSWGDLFQRLGLLTTPVDINPPEELAQLVENLQRTQSYDPFNIPLDQGFVRALVIPRIFTLHTALAYNRRRPSKVKAIRLAALVSRALDKGPNSLSNKEKKALLSDQSSLRNLHREIWNLYDGEKAARWGLP
ncbi:MAG: glucans biosynthesis glucosyltransferase MdoH [Candidatus Adiutrix intracellularis]|jgi:membrane glycosyltransferase|nr:glucans biosynthesis glucosyltransferase MdoH [Candidatus Adiutrix intracellularis]